MKRKPFLAMFSSILALVAMVLLAVPATASEEYVEYKNSTRYFSIGDDFFQYNILYPTGLSGYTWDILENETPYGVKVQKIDKANAQLSSELLGISDIRIDDITQMKNVLAHLEEERSEWDINLDGTYDIVDLLLATRTYANNPVHFITADGKFMELADFIELVKYYNEKDETAFVVKYGDKVPAVTTATTTTVQTTTTVTTKATSATTATTPKSTTTVTTVTTLTTSTTTVTMKTEPDPKEEPLYYNDVSEILDKVCITDVEIPEFKDDRFYEAKDYIYSFEYEGIKYCYTLLYEEKPELQCSLFLKPALISGVHIWKYTGNQEVLDITNKPDPINAEGKTFEYKGKTYDYQLVPIDEIYVGTIEMMCYTLSSMSNGTNRSDEIARYDFNLNGEVDMDDLEFATRYVTSNITETYPRVIEFYYKEILSLGLDHYVMIYSTDIVEYSYVVPDSDFAYNTALWDSLPSQVLGKEYYEEYAEKYGIYFEETSKYDFILWRKDEGWHPEGTPETVWMPIALRSTDENSEWISTGFYAMRLDENGEYIKELTDTFLII